MRLIQNARPKLRLPKFQVDTPLSKHLEADPLLQHMNRSFCTALISKAGGGKTSFMCGLLSTPKKLLRVFHRIYVWMPNSSQQSMEDCIFNILPDDRKFEALTYESLEAVFIRLLEDTEKLTTQGEHIRSLLVFDDCQSAFKDKEIEKNLLHIVSNRRHLRCSVFCILQNYVKCPLDIRKAFTHMFLWNLNKEEWKKIYEEQIDAVNRDDFEECLSEFRKQRVDDPHTFLFLKNGGDKVFINWNECVFEEMEEDDDETEATEK